MTSHWAGAGKRWRSGIVGGLLLMSVGGAYPVLVPAAAADPSACATPTNTLSGGGNQALRVRSWEVLLLAAGTYTGPIDILEHGGTLCLAADATLNTSAVRKPEGSVVVQGSARFPSFSSRSGFALFVAGSVVINRATLLGSSSVEVAAGGTLTGGTLMLLSGSLTTNAGTIDSDIETSGGSTLINSGDLIARDGLEIEGPLFNSGQITAHNGPVEFTYGSTVVNSCVIVSTGDVLVTSSSSVINSGTVRALSGSLRVVGKYTQSPIGITLAESLDSDGVVFGFGRYRFERFTRSAGVFAGASAAEPILVEDVSASPPPAIFDVQTGTVVNVVAGSVTDPGLTSLPGDCVPGGGSPVADVTVAKIGPAVVEAGGRITYTVVLTNNGPDPASDLVITDILPPELTGLDAPGGTLSPGPPPTAQWTLPELTVGASATFSVSATVPDSGTLLNQASARAGTHDPNPANNDGSSPAQRLSTEIQPGTPANVAPVVDDGTFSTSAGHPVIGIIAYSDQDTQQQHVARRSQPPGSGTLSMSPSGVFVYTPRFDFSGLDTFTAIVCDNGNPVLCDEGMVTVAVAPLAVDDTAYTTLELAVRIDVLHNDIGDTGAPTVLGQPEFGTAAVSGNEIVYTPESGFIGVDELGYRTCAPAEPSVCANATVTVVVDVNPNQPPVADDVAVTTVVDTQVAGAVPVYDPDVGQPVSTHLLRPPDSGTAVVAVDGSFTYTPDSGFAGRDAFEVEACDNARGSGCDAATATVTVKPIAGPDTAQTEEGKPVGIDVRANDLGTIGQPVVTIEPTSGTAVVQPGRTITYTPNPAFTGLDTFQYRVCASTDNTVCDSAPVTITVGPTPNRPPVIQPLTLATVADRPVTGHLVYYDPDVGQTLTVAVESGPAHGAADIDERAIVSYVPVADFTGRDEFTIVVCDNAAPALCEHSTVPVTVTPLVLPDAAAVEIDSTVDIPATANDRGEFGPATITVPPGFGAAEVTTDSIRYTPDPGFAGRDSLTYQVCSLVDPSVCGSAQVHIAVLLVAVTDAVATISGQPVQAPVLANDILGPGVVVTIRANPSSGTATVGPDGTITYTPQGIFTGIDAFIYQVCTPAGAPHCATAPVTVFIGPLLKDDVASTKPNQSVTIPVVDNDIGGATRAVVTTPPAHGTVEGSGLTEILALDAGNVPVLGNVVPLVYTPHPGFLGTDTFTYRRCAPSSPSVCGFADVIVFVAPAPAGGQPPTSTPPPAGTEPPTGTAPPAPDADFASTTGSPGSLASTGFGLALLAIAGLVILSGAALRVASRRRGKPGSGPD
ncbi:MAG: Ig-like domain-containing protein [Labedaea sp.]